MAKSQRSLGQLELEVLKIVWERQKSTVGKVVETLAKSRPCARTTVLTVIQRLHAKGFLKRRKVGGILQYSPTKGRGLVISNLISQFVDKVLDGSPAPFVAYLAQSKDLTEEQADQLHELAEQLKIGAKEK